jgi:hypothetical protein
MTSILILFAVAQLVIPVLLIRRFRWQGILGAFAFTAALHYGFHRVCIARDAETATFYGAVVFSFVMLAVGLVYCIIAIAIVGAFSPREAAKDGETHGHAA